MQILFHNVFITDTHRASWGLIALNILLSVVCDIGELATYRASRGLIALNIVLYSVVCENDVAYFWS